MKCASDYVTINDFGGAAAQAPVNNPLSTALSSPLDNMLMHGSNRLNEDSHKTQAFMAQFISENFDSPFAQYAVNDNTPQYYPNLFHSSSNIGNNNFAMANANPNPGPNPRVVATKGDIALLNAAAFKYLVQMQGGTPHVVPFDETVAGSPKVTLWKGATMIPHYAIPAGVDVDKCGLVCELMKRPWISFPFFHNVYRTMSAMGTLSRLDGKKAAGFMSSVMGMGSKSSKPSKLSSILAKTAPPAMQQ
jgi:hypothetical protein